MWWIALKLAKPLAPFAQGILGRIMTFGLVIGFVVAVGYGAGVDVAGVALDLVVNLLEQGVSAVADEISPF